MPVLKINKNGVWQDVANALSHAHTMSDIADLPASIVDDVEALKDKVGANSVAYQISTAVTTNAYQHPYTHPASMITGLSDVAISGSYNDLTDLPTIPTQIQANWNQTNEMYPDYIQNKPDIPSVEGLATETYVNDEIAKIPKVDLSSYAMKKDIPDVSGFATETYVKEEIAKANISGGSGGGEGSSTIFVRADWNQNDETQSDYIRNRPFYETIVNTELINDNFTFTLNSDLGAFIAHRVVSEEYVNLWNSDWADDVTVVWDGVTFTSQPKDLMGLKCVGNVEAFLQTGNSGHPFIISIDDKGIFSSNVMLLIVSLVDTSDAAHDVSINIPINDIVKIPNKYLSQPDWDEIDKNNNSYIKNKPFGIIPSGTVVVDETTADCSIQEDDNMWLTYLPDYGRIIVPSTYNIEFDGISYTIDAIGNGEVYIYEGSTFIFVISSGACILASTQGEHTYKFTLAEDVVRKIDAIYIPEIDSLPKVTTSDDNKVMTVVNGEWTAKTPASGLPTVTTSDAGKFLRVNSSGAWAVQSIANAEEASF